MLLNGHINYVLVSTGDKFEPQHIHKIIFSRRGMGFTTVYPPIQAFQGCFFQVAVYYAVTHFKQAFQGVEMTSDKVPKNGCNLLAKIPTTNWN